MCPLSGIHFRLSHVRYPARSGHSLGRDLGRKVTPLTACTLREDRGKTAPFFLGGGGGGGQRIIFKGQSRNLWGMRLSQSEATRRGRGQEGSAVGGLGRAVWSALKSQPWTSVTHGGALRMQKFRPPAVENSELTNVLFKAWSRSDYSDLRFHHCREFLLCLNF